MIIALDCALAPPPVSKVFETDTMVELLITFPREFAKKPDVEAGSGT
jgi:hypothetical protein